MNLGTTGRGKERLKSYLMRATNTKVTEMMKTMLENKDKMEKQGNMIRSNQASSNIQKEMIKYTEEKARYNDNLLKVYSFLNIVALGVLLYVYKAAE